MPRHLIAALLLASATAGAQRVGDDKRALVGVWRFAGEVDTHDDGSPAPATALGDTQGQLVYTADGFMSVVLMPKSRAWSTESATSAELRETVANGTAYAGRYEVDAAHHTVTHFVSVSMEPQFEAQRLVRGYVLSGDSLRLTGTFPYRGETIHFAITWTRMRGQP